MEIKAKEIQMVPVKEIKPWPKNPNKHSKEQIERLMKVIEYQGFRQPLVVSNLSGFLISGHGRLSVAKKLKMKEVPVIFEDFEDEAQEYAHVVADNATAEWAELDFKLINEDIGDLGPDFDVDMLGIKDFGVDVNDKPKDEERERGSGSKTCPECGHEW